MNTFLLSAALFAACITFVSAEPFSAHPASPQSFSILRNKSPYIDFRLAGFGPNWSYFNIKGTLTSAGKKMIAENHGQSGGADVTIQVTAEWVDKNEVKLSYVTSASKSIPVTMVTAGLNFEPAEFVGGKIRVTTADGTETELTMPLGKEGIGRNVKQCVLVDSRGAKTALTFDPACDIASDVQGRILLAEGTLSEASSQSITITLPAETSFYTTPEDVPFEPGFDEWYPFNPSDRFAEDSEIGMADWLDKPAGQYGRITRKEDQLIYNNEPIKLWGLNVTYGGCAPQREIADRRAAMYAKYGLNAVRLHKYADGAGWQGILKQNSFVEFDPNALDRMDYFVNQLKEVGIYIKLSSTFGVKIGKEEFDRIAYLDELGSVGPTGRVETRHGSIWFSKELQDMQIEQVINLLDHENPYTGERYADDPAVAVVELYNEDSILFFGTIGYLQKSPTLRKRAAREFTDWLENRYGTKKACLAAWGGESALNCFINEGFTDESWEERSIVPAGNPWFYDPDQLEGDYRRIKTRLLDTMRFLYEKQNAFYSRYVKAIRNTGYEGEILASNWQAGRAFSHYYNLHSDSLVGLIDRHNYFGGGSPTRINNATMLTHPGSGMISAGMQQVDDRPFMLSEWIHVQPNEWSVEGPAIIGTYGLGLQGWDASFMFENDDSAHFNKALYEKMWNDVTKPNVLGFCPAISRQVLRGDVEESKKIAVRYVHVPSLGKGIIGFDEQVKQSGDIKSFTGEKVPDLALAAARCVVDFTDEFQPTPVFDMTAYQTPDGAIKSSTGELCWTPGKKPIDGFFTVDTPATKAVVGFAQGETCKLGKVTIEPLSRFGAIYVTAQNQDEDLESAKHALIVAIARCRNSGMNVIADELILTKGTGPILMEPVKARIDLGRSVKQVILLDHDGQRTSKKLSVESGAFEINGSEDHTCYYLVTF